MWVRAWAREPVLALALVLVLAQAQVLALVWVPESVLAWALAQARSVLGLALVRRSASVLPVALVQQAERRVAPREASVRFLSAERASLGQPPLEHLRGTQGVRSGRPVHSTLERSGRGANGMRGRYRRTEEPQSSKPGRSCLNVRTVATWRTASRWGVNIPEKCSEHPTARGGLRVVQTLSSC